ncbi:DUF7677 family protein [Streptomyces pilosus]|uniref:DUF7677 domain-containing protein n=1 Tax=Streptomyces pilosus TaxID=28893 RepID=A0A918BZ91_9ACTN|nr:hypothetical protein GCM10010280_51320 [Streptomyces pilosus]
MLAIFANALELDEHGEPVNEKYAERRAATDLYSYCTPGKAGPARDPAPLHSGAIR